MYPVTLRAAATVAIAIGSLFHGGTLTRFGSTQGDPEREFQERLVRTETPDELEKLLKEYSQYKFASRALVKLESTLIGQIERDGPGDRLVFPALRPRGSGGAQTVGFDLRAGDAGLRVTSISLEQKVESGRSFVVLTSESPNDVVEVNMATGFPAIPFDNRTVHRFIGRAEFRFLRDAGVRAFAGEGDSLNRLTFALIANVGYVYLRGKGTVLTADGKAVQLGGPAELQPKLAPPEQISRGAATQGSVTGTLGMVIILRDDPEHFLLTLKEQPNVSYRLTRRDVVEWGLMAIQPTENGLTMYQRVYGEDWKVSLRYEMRDSERHLTSLKRIVQPAARGR